MRPPFARLTLAAALALSACSADPNEGAPPVAPSRIAVHVSIAPEGLRVMSVSHAASAAEAPPRFARTLRYAFTAPDGAALAEGRVEDPRPAHVEWFADGQPQRAEGAHASASLLLRLPSAAGTVELFEENALGAAHSLGTVSVALPDEVELPGTSTEAILRRDDVLGAPVKVVDHGGSAQRFDLLFLPEGYTEEELPRFAAAVERVARELSLRSDWGAHWGQVNVWRIDVRSRTSGISAAQPAPLQDTAFSLRRDEALDRLIVAGHRRSMAVATELGERVSADRIVIITNSSYGGAGGTVAVAADDASLTGVVAHELGHSLLGLADEYFNHLAPERSDDECRDEAPTAPNVSHTALRDELPWGDLVSHETELPTPAGTPALGAFLGGDRCRAFRYRPTERCLMGPALSVPLCPVCRRALDLYFTRYPAGAPAERTPPRADAGAPDGDASAPTADAAPTHDAAHDAADDAALDASVDGAAPGPDAHGLDASALDAGSRDDVRVMPPPDPSCAYTCASRGYRAGQCFMGWYCDGTCVRNTGCTERTAPDGCDYTCAAYGYAPGQCVDGYLCDGVCVRFTGCR